MGTLLFITFAVIVVVIGAILQRNHNEKHGNTRTPAANQYLEERYQENLKELREEDRKYHEMLQLWKEFHTKYESLGEPTIRIGYFHENGRMPWEFPTIHIPYDEIAAEPDPGKRLNMVDNAHLQLKLDHGIPGIGMCATIWKEARTAVLGREELHPEEIRFVKSNRNNPLKWIEVIVTTTQLERPTVSVFFEPVDRSTADELKAAITAFKQIK